MGRNDKKLSNRRGSSSYRDEDKRGHDHTSENGGGRQHMRRKQYAGKDRSSDEQKRKRRKDDHHRRHEYKRSRRRPRDEADDSCDEADDSNNSSEGEYYSSSYSSEDERQRRHHSSSSRKHDDQKRKKKKRTKSKKEKKDKDKKKESRKRTRSKKKEHSETPLATTTYDMDPIMRRNYVVTDALHQLLLEHPTFATDLPVMLIRMAEGTSFELTRMPVDAARALEKVFESLSSLGVAKDHSGSAWIWQAPPGPSRNRDPLILLRLVRSMLDEVGVTMDAVSTFGMSSTRNNVVTQSKPVNSSPDEGSPLQMITLKFLKSNSTSKEESIGLAKEFAGICNMVLNGESVSLEGMSNQSMKDGMETLFKEVGLVKVEMEESDDDDDDDDDEEDHHNDEPQMGFSLRDDNDEAVKLSRKRLEEVIETCKATESGSFLSISTAMKGTSGPNSALAVDEASSSEEEDGPAPVGSARARKRVQKGPALPPEMVRAMADQRRQELEQVSGVKGPSTNPDEREDWMMNPGEHDLLQGIKSGKVMKSRNFQNTKVSANMDRGPVDKLVQAEVDAIMAAHQEARGPSLMDQHRAKVAAEKAAKKKGKNDDHFTWTRDKDLDAGRRVDKDALKMIMGGAGSTLKDKFAGGLGRT